MAEITVTVGFTGRTYSTLVAFKDDLDNDTPFDAGDDIIGDCYDDTDPSFDEGVTWSTGGTLVLNSVTIQAASGQEHDGTEGTGVYNQLSTSALTTFSSTIPHTLQNFEIDGNGNWAMVRSTGTTPIYSLIRCLVHGMSRGGEIRGILINSSTQLYVSNCIVYDITNTHAGASHCHGIESLTGDTQYIQNTVVMNCTGTTGTGDSYGISTLDNANTTVENCIVGGTVGNGSGAADDYEQSAPSNATYTTNMSEDATAVGTALDSKVMATQFVSTTNDFHIKTGADAIGEGTDLTTTAWQVEVDIDLFDRDAGAVTWDVGAHQLPAVGGGGILPQITTAYHRIAA